MIAHHTIPRTLAVLAVVGALAAAASTAGEPALSPEAHKALGEALDAYEQARALLAADRMEDLDAKMQAIEKTAKAARTAAPEAIAPLLLALGERAAALEKVPKDRPVEVRKAFGEVSHAVVDIVVAAPELAEGRHVFECPMAPGYQKWVQLGDRPSNPYMGARMATCGKASTWR